jgi:soluble lytic murein transglycosylase-like protein
VQEPHAQAPGASHSPAPAAASAYAPIIAREAARHDLPRALVEAVIAVESGFRQNAVSPRGARGLMQLMPATAKRWGVQDVHDPQENIAAGARHLRMLLDRYRRVDLALAAYNAGEGALARFGERVPPYAETRAYVPRVLARAGWSGAKRERDLLPLPAGRGS